MNLYHATVEVDVYFWSDSDACAEHDAERAACEALRDASEGAAVLVTPIGADHKPPNEWLDAHPYGEGRDVPDLTVGEAVEKLREERDVAAKAAAYEAAQGRLPL